MADLGDEFAERLSEADLTSGRVSDHFARYLFAAHYVSGRTVVDLCCGLGYGANLLLAAGAVKVNGIDADPDAIANAHRLYPGAEFAVGRVDQPLDLRDFNVRVCFEGIEHVSDPEQLLANMRGAELAFISSPNADLFEQGFSGNPYHVREWTRSEFELLLSRHFSEVRMYFQWYYPDPLDQDWSFHAAAKALVPVALKARLRPPPKTTPSDGPQLVTGAQHALSRVYPTSYLFVLPPGLRYGRPSNWVAVCRA
jgi:SAM-dependent methyltransferase